MSKIEIDTDEIQPLINMLYLSSESKVIHLANYIKKDSLDKNQAEFGNTCADYQNFIYEKFGVYLHNNMLNEKNTDIIDRNIRKENMRLQAEINRLKKAINSALNFMACPDDLSELTGKCNDQAAFDELREALNGE